MKSNKLNQINIYYFKTKLQVSTAFHLVSKKAFRKNVIFYDNEANAIRDRFRACKICFKAAS